MAPRNRNSKKKTKRKPYILGRVLERFARKRNSNSKQPRSPVSVVDIFSAVDPPGTTPTATEAQQQHGINNNNNNNDLVLNWLGDPEELVEAPLFQHEHEEQDTTTTTFQKDLVENTVVHRAHDPISLPPLLSRKPSHQQAPAAATVNDDDDDDVVDDEESLENGKISSSSSASLLRPDRKGPPTGSSSSITQLITKETERTVAELPPAALEAPSVSQSPTPTLASPTQLIDTTSATASAKTTTASSSSSSNPPYRRDTPTASTNIHGNTATSSTRTSNPHLVSTSSPVRNMEPSVGSRVRITTRRHCFGMTGIITRAIGKTMWEVRLEDTNEPVRKKKTSVVLVDGPADPPTSTSTSSATAATRSSMECAAVSGEVTTATTAPTAVPLEPAVADAAPGAVVTLANRVSIIRGDHKGSTAVVTKLKGTKMLDVVIDGTNEPVGVRKTSVQVLDSRNASSARNETLQGSAQRQGSSSAGRRNVMTSVPTRSVPPISPSVQNVSQNGKEWRLEDSLRGGMRFGTWKVLKLRLSTKNQSPNKETTLLSHLLGNRILVSEIALNKTELAKPFDRFVESNGREYELVSTKVKADGDAGSGNPYAKSQCVELCYAQIAGRGLATWSIPQELSKLANFAGLNPRKVKARLELLQSPSYVFSDKSPGLFFLKKLDFCEIEDRGYVGCGFISDEMLTQFCKSKSLAQRTLAIQVRIVIPMMGIFKGMLCRKRITDGSPIQLPKSMLKVPASLDPDVDDRACLLITKNGFHANKTNWYVGRKLDPSQKPPPQKSFDSKLKKPLSEMVTRMWKGLGVPEAAFEPYVKKATKNQYLQHAWIVGLADPTDSLPPGHIFVPGLREHTPDELFVTRSPCLNPADGRMLPTVRNKPTEMSAEDWDFLGNLPFGGIIFANPLRGMVSIPEQIAQGDLDGDLYLICWNPDILKRINAEPVKDIVTEDETTAEAMNVDSGNAGWFSTAQDLMLDAVSTQSVNTLIGKLYTLSQKIADASPLFHADPDAIACANAYNQALDYAKHGRPPQLPTHLHNRLPERLRSLVVDVGTEDGYANIGPSTEEDDEEEQSVGSPVDGEEARIEVFTGENQEEELH